MSLDDALAHAAEVVPNGSQSAALCDGFNGTDVGNAARFVAAADGRARYVHAWQRWMFYRDGVWELDAGDALVTELCKEVARRMFARAAEHGKNGDDLWKWAKRSESSASVKSMLHLARGIPGVLVEHDDLDRDRYLLNVRNGTIDLRTGELRSHNPDDLLTMQAPVMFEPTATAPLWDACLLRWQPDPEMRAYLQRVVGSGAVGHPVEALFINLGTGANGKGKFYGAVTHVLGPYAAVPHESLITVQRHEQHDTVKARLFGVRLAVAGETDSGARLDEAKVKELTGGDMLEARRMREDPWKFLPSHTMVMHTNYRPRVRGSDEGIWRRIRLIDWPVTIPEHERDDDLATKLIAEASGILNFVIVGARAWIDSGLQDPEPVRTATAAYRADEDHLSTFIEAKCETGPTFVVVNADLCRCYENWCQDTGQDPLTKQLFGRSLSERGYVLDRGRRHRHGLRLTAAASIASISLLPTRDDEISGGTGTSTHSTQSLPGNGSDGGAHGRDDAIRGTEPW